MNADVWYDRHCKTWVLQWKDESNNQIGFSEYYYSKREALSAAASGFNQ